MLERYYWYEDIPQSIDYDDFESSDELLDFLKNDEFDRFSYITSQSSFESLFSAGQYVGYGFGFVVESDDKVFTRFVYDDSPVGREGIIRGDEILSINDQLVAEIIAEDGWSSVFGPSEIGIPLSLEVRRADNTTETLDVTKDVVTINTVLHHEVIEISGIKTGYLVFNSFLSTSRAELESVFQEFSSAGIDELILDLRYNGGGSVAVGRDLASYITDGSSNTYVELRHNDKNQHRNFTYFYRNLAHDLDLDAATIITTGATCSASEQIISGLAPYMEVKTVGNTTCGKPIGMNSENFCDKTLLAINFASFNANGEGEYFDGLEATCGAEDDVSFRFGDINEPMLNTALELNDSGSCPVSKSSSKQLANVSPLSGIGQIINAW